MTQIRDLTTDIVSKVRGGMGQEVQGNFKAIEVKCPKCGGGPFKESFKAYECTNSECKLIVWKSMSGRELERDEVAKLLTEGRVGPLEGFRSKMGRAFSAEIILSERRNGNRNSTSKRTAKARAAGKHSIRQRPKRWATRRRVPCTRQKPRSFACRPQMAPNPSAWGK